MSTLRTRAFTALLPAAPSCTERAPERTHHARLRAHDARLLCAEVEPVHVRVAMRSALVTVAAELGCVVCGRPLPFESAARSTLPVHLWGPCLDRLSAATGVSVDVLLTMRGEP